MSLLPYYVECSFAHHSQLSEIVPAYQITVHLLHKLVTHVLKASNYLRIVIAEPFLAHSHRLSPQQTPVINLPESDILQTSAHYFTAIKRVKLYIENRFDSLVSEANYVLILPASHLNTEMLIHPHTHYEFTVFTELYPQNPIVMISV